MRSAVMKNNKAAQDIARETLRLLHGYVQVGMSEKDIAAQALAWMGEKGSNSWWYHGIGAVVLLGRRSVASMPGRQYQASEDNKVERHDVITVDLAPTVDGYWGDYARTLFVEDGIVAPEDDPRDPEFRRGIEAEMQLHRFMMEIARPDMPFEELFVRLNAEITRLGFENLDFKGNLGHTIEMDQADRIYIERGSTVPIGRGRGFTLEPHIRALGGAFGYKREDIYYFDESGILRLL
jgi:Xaa-Pro aminopeptidase